MKNEDYKFLDNTGNAPVSDLESIRLESQHAYAEAIEKFTKGISYESHPVLELARKLLKSFYDNNSKDSIQISEILFDKAEQYLHSIPYAKIGQEYREFYLLASLGLSITRLKELCNDITTEVIGVDRIVEVLHVLNTSEVVSGPGPHILYPYVLRLSKEITKILEKFIIKNPDDYIIHLKEPQIRIDSPTKQYFDTLKLSDFVSMTTGDGCPFVIRNAASHWPALHTRPWNNLSYLIDVIGPFRLVPVELGSKYTDPDWSQKLLPFKEFIDRYILGSNQSNDKKGYLAQHNIFSQTPELLKDIVIPDYCYMLPTNPEAENTNVIINSWIGPQGTVSPLHTDPYHNMFVQMVGYKYFKLYSNSQRSKLYVYEGSDFFSNTSEVNFEDIDYEKFPLIREAPHLECVLGPGDMLYIPKHWWHFVMSLSVSCSVSFWFS